MRFGISQKIVFVFVLLIISLEVITGIGFSQFKHPLRALERVLYVVNTVFKS